jgi:hypothetical protein
MRKIGHSLLLIGFIWFVVGEVLAGSAARAVVLRHYDQVSNQQTFTRDQVQKQIRESVFEAVDSMPWFFLPALAMLTGAVCIDRARRH